MRLRSAHRRCRAGGAALRKATSTCKLDCRKRLQCRRQVASPGWSLCRCGCCIIKMHAQPAGCAAAAGIIAAAGNDRQQVAGVTWGAPAGSAVRLLACKFISSLGFGYTSGAGAALPNLHARAPAPALACVCMLAAVPYPAPCLPCLTAHQPLQPAAQDRRLALCPIPLDPPCAFPPTSLSAVSCFKYCRANGAAVISASWSAGGQSNPALEEALRDARAAGVLVVAAAGVPRLSSSQHPACRARCLVQALFAAACGLHRGHWGGRLGVARPRLAPLVGCCLPRPMGPSLPCPPGRQPRPGPVGRPHLPGSLWGRLRQRADRGIQRRHRRLGEQQQLRRAGGEGGRVDVEL